MTNAREIPVRLALIEATQLARLVDELTDVIAAADGTPDPAVDRLAPAPYPEDAAASGEFAAATRDDLLDRRTADAAVVRRALAPFVDGLMPKEDDAPPHVDVAVRPREVDAWLRTLTALRLVIATRLGVDEDDEHDPEDARFGVYDWLAYRLESLIAVADALDEIAGNDD